jgi:hypothetical protein
VYVDDAAKNSRSFLQHGREGKTGQHDGDEYGQHQEKKEDLNIYWEARGQEGPREWRR